MNKIIITAGLSILLGLSIGWFFFGTPPVGGNTAEFADASTERIAYYRDPMHPWYTSDKPGKAPDCGMDLVPVYEGTGSFEGIKIDPVTIQNIGVKTELISKRRLNKTIRMTGKIDYDERKVHTVNTKIMGWVEKLHVDYSGQAVNIGDPLMDLYSPELVTTQQEYLQAIRYRTQLAGSANEEAKKGAEELVQSAKRRLLYWDIPESEIKDLEERGTPRKTMTINSPVSGVVIDKMVLPGQNVMPGMMLYKIADLSTLWILADVYEYELPWVQTGQKAEIEFSYLPGKDFMGTITYIYPYLSPETRTARVRIQVNNTPAHEFKPEMYVTVKLISPLFSEALAVPDQAVIRSGERNIVVISLGGGYFDPREVKLGVTADGYTQIIDGVHEGETVVTSSQFLIDSESNLKAAISSMSGHAGMDMSKPMGKPADLSKYFVPAETSAVSPKPVDHTGHPIRGSEPDKVQHKGVIDPQENDSSRQQIDQPEKQVIYTCVMHPQIRIDRPGDCPLCGMKLVPVPSDSTRSDHDH
jgi:multidrug efflux pump subunit AcrA (membrane-fusion protein)